jgi:hypothetical protein
MLEMRLALALTIRHMLLYRKLTKVVNGAKRRLPFGFRVTAWEPRHELREG